MGVIGHLKYQKIFQMMLGKNLSIACIGESLTKNCEDMDNNKWY